MMVEILKLARLYFPPSFKPWPLGTGKGHGLNDGGKYSRASLFSIIRILQRQLDEDFEDGTVVVHSTDEDEPKIQ